MPKPKEKVVYSTMYESSRHLIKVEAAKKKMSQPEFIQALLKVYKAHWKAAPTLISPEFRKRKPLTKATAKKIWEGDL